jgi:hypothetical protein
VNQQPQSHFAEVVLQTRMTSFYDKSLTLHQQVCRQERT